MFEVVIQFPDGTDCATASVQNLVDATAEAMLMYQAGHLAVLRCEGKAINQWLGTRWESPLPV